MISETDSLALEGKFKKAKPMANFNRLSKVVRLYEPSLGQNSPTSPTDPTTVLFCAWMNGSSKHIDYYTRTYKRLYPNARIICVTMSTEEFLLTSETTRRKQVKSAVTALLALPQEQERLLVHSISNGGAKRLYAICAAYRSVTGKPLPLKALILDSAPGIPQFRRDIYALSVPARKLNWFLRMLFITVVFLVTCVVYVTVNWMPRWFWYELVWGPHDGLMHFELINRDCVQGFVYSKEDLAIDWRHVETHAANCEKKGYRVVKKRVEAAGHAQMFRGKGGEEDYWGYIQKIWGMGVGLDVE